MSVVGALGTRILASLAFYTRGAVARAGTGPVVVVALAAAALIYSWRQRKRTANPDRRRRTTGGSRAGSSTSRRQREQKRLKILAGVQRVTIGVEAGTLPGAIFELAGHVAQAATDTDQRSRLLEDSADEIQAVRSPEHPATTAGTLDNSVVNSQGLTMKPEIAKNLQNFATLFDLYLVIRVNSDEAEQAVTNALRDGHVFKRGLDPRKVIFCDTTAGRVSIVRQIEPDLHIDETASVVSGLQRFVKFVAFVSPSAKSAAGPSGGNILKYSTLSKFFETASPNS